MTMSMIDIPDEVRNAACCWALETGRWPQWFIELQAGRGTGRLPSVSHAGIGQYRAAIRKHLEKSPQMRMSPAAQLGFCGCALEERIFIPTAETAAP